MHALRRTGSANATAARVVGVNDMSVILPTSNRDMQEKTWNVNRWQRGHTRIYDQWPDGHTPQSTGSRRRFGAVSRARPSQAAAAAHGQSQVVSRRRQQLPPASAGAQPRHDLLQILRQGLVDLDPLPRD